MINVLCASLFYTFLSLSVSSSGMTIPEEDTEAGQTGKYCLVAIGRLQVCVWWHSQLTEGVWKLSYLSVCMCALPERLREV